MRSTKTAFRNRNYKTEINTGISQDLHCLKEQLNFAIPEELKYTNSCLKSTFNFPLIFKLFKDYLKNFHPGILNTEVTKDYKSPDMFLSFLLNKLELTTQYSSIHFLEDDNSLLFLKNELSDFDEIFSFNVEHIYSIKSYPLRIAYAHIAKMFLFDNLSYNYNISPSSSEFISFYNDRYKDYLEMNFCEEVEYDFTSNSEEEEIDTTDVYFEAKEIFNRDWKEQSKKRKKYLDYVLKLSQKPIFIFHEWHKNFNKKTEKEIQLSNILVYLLKENFYELLYGFTTDPSDGDYLDLSSYLTFEFFPDCLISQELNQDILQSLNQVGMSYHYTWSAVSLNSKNIKITSTELFLEKKFTEYYKKLKELCVLTQP